MAMSGSVLAQSVRDAMDASSEFADNQSGPSAAFVDLLCAQIVDHIKTTATVTTVVNTEVTGASVSGGPVTGKGIGSGAGAPGSIK